jgi:hypothetical protein
MILINYNNIKINTKIKCKIRYKHRYNKICKNKYTWLNGQYFINNIKKILNKLYKALFIHKNVKQQKNYLQKNKC